MTVREEGTDRTMLDQARAYRERHGVRAEYGLSEGPIVPALLGEVRAHGAALLISGSYEYSALLEPISGACSTNSFAKAGRRY